VSGSRDVTVVRLQGAARRELGDHVAEEEPLEIQVQGVPVAVVMRTPGHDEDLARGFLITERVVERLEDVRRIRHCDTVVDPEAEDNVIQVTLEENVDLDLERLRRNLYASSSCGVCGKATIENAMATAPPLEDDVRVNSATFYSLPALLRAAQPTFDRTGGLHAAGLFSPAGELLCLREDVGRHNAVDKIVGWAVAAGQALTGHVLLVSGRVGFEIVQKALAARIPIVAGISAPTSLAVRLAAASDITLVGFLRGASMNVYAGAERVAP